MINKFKKQFISWLPPHQNKHDFKIELKPNITPKFSPLYSMLQEELLNVFHHYLGHTITSVKNAWYYQLSH